MRRSRCTACEAVLIAATALPALSQSPAKARQLDFWLGEWEVRPFQNENAPVAGTSKIEKSGGGFAILESWKSAGFTGNSWNYFDTKKGLWKQIWVDQSGRTLDYSGTFRRVFKSRMTITKQKDGSVRQEIERSTDEGKTWTKTIDYRYVKKATK